MVFEQTKRALVTGGAGFIGSHVVERLLADGWSVTIIDNFDHFYDETLKERNIQNFVTNSRCSLIRADIRDLAALQSICGGFTAIIHLAARAGVRPSIDNAVTYQQVNVAGTQNLLEFAKERGIKQFVFASSSSVYGVNAELPWKESDHVLLPISPYASTKVSGEMLGHVYSHLYGIRFLALRFFTVYGPRQRPDLAIHKFAKLMLEKKSIPLFGDGSARRDYTFIDDIVQGIIAAVDYNRTSYEVINLGNNSSVSLDEMISLLESALQVKSTIDRLPVQPGDLPQTWADISKARELLGFVPQTTFQDGITIFADWFRQVDETENGHGKTERSIH